MEKLIKKTHMPAALSEEGRAGREANTREKTVPTRQPKTKYHRFVYPRKANVSARVATSGFSEYDMVPSEDSR
ncbi:hypothetical protein AGDE_15504 [Angomonas deanei]|uniref:Uncharacterized protein n=1 Tax=Angomonas deanei TaxID=59799 RepID=A0A7G2CQY9_9TRYP|nr:hypothetical protein AGDE_15504 [Angomonas deanei]CAD2221557.1 hypothetical protein, conserved [Angomonas deanei]|eukprot:EPY18957.1 hypothetical protein AGDE_15504 [Angomonas deanei]